ncbi:hypothetical protein BBAD15_g10784 [Beauveria bassiana D1-5]|uniref:Uncharacterized protein n=1 Tax=Beauveria bassiana D1-5 TaxID=1245745 RepID=A0A0A2VT91_BEABA|nr:hypothetical protein BBAD15_g10784 [Beauveria bassiana D1-5]
MLRIRWPCLAFAYSIYVHNDFDWRNDPTVYVSTTAEFGVAARFAQPGDYIYLVRARSNMVSVNIALGRRSRYPWQDEWVAMQTRALDISKTEAGKQLCAASDQPCRNKSSSLVQTRFPQRDPGKVERTAHDLEAICERSLGGPPAERHGGPDSVAGPSGLCRSQAAKALEPVRAKSRGQKRPTQEVVSDVKGAVCAASPPSNKAKGAKEQCENSVQELLSVFNDVGGVDIGNYLSNPDEIDKDLCFEPGTFEYLSSFPWDQALPTGMHENPLDSSKFPVMIWGSLSSYIQGRLVLASSVAARSTPQQGQNSWLHFPGILQLLEDMARLGLCFSSCLSDKPASGRRLKARQDQGQSAPSDSQPDKTPSTTPGSQPGQDVSQDSKGNYGPSGADTKLWLAIGIPASVFAAGGLSVFAVSAEGTALLASAAAELGISTKVGSASEVVTSVLGRTTSLLTQVTRQAVQRVVGRVSRLGHRVANPLLRQITSRALRSATERASEHIPLLSFSG